jgi:hypothetical protein
MSLRREVEGKKNLAIFLFYLRRKKNDIVMMSFFLLLFKVLGTSFCALAF